MTDHDDITQRVRTGLQSIIEGAGEPPDWPLHSHAQHRARSRSGPLTVMILSTVVIVAAASALWLRGRGTDQVEQQQSRLGLYSSWLLADMTSNGVPVDTSGATGIRWQIVEDFHCREGPPSCVPGPRVVGSDGCNHFERGVEVSADLVTWGASGFVTSKGCLDHVDVTAAFTSFLSAPTFTYEIADGKLRLGANGIELVFVEHSGLFGPPSGTVLDERETGSLAWRLSWRGELVLETSDLATPGSRTLVYTLTDNPGGATARAAGAYLMVILPVDAASAQFIASDGTIHEVDVFDPVATTSSRPAGRLIEAPSVAGRLIALDAAGNEIVRLDLADTSSIVSTPPPATAPASTSIP